MYFADEVRDPKAEIEGLPRRGAAKKAELSMAQQLIDSMAGPWRPEEFRDTYADRVNDLIKQKKAGKEITAASPAPEPTNVTDLFEVLRRSVEDAQKRQGRPAGKAAKKASKKASKPAAKKTTSKKTDAKRATPKKAAQKKASAKKAAPERRAS
jgi:DNA end-binding protein Ku